MRRWLVCHALLLSLTLLLYETVLAVLLSGQSATIVKPSILTIENCSHTDCEAACRQTSTFFCRSFKFLSSSRFCLLSGYNITEEPRPGSLSTVDRDARTDTRVAVRQPRNAFNEGLEENVDKIWHDLAKYENDKHTLQEFEKLVVKELKIKSEEIQELKSERIQQDEEISGLKQAIAKLLTKSNMVDEKLQDIKTVQTNQQNQISGLEFSDEKLTAGMGKLIVQTEGLDGRVDSLTKDNTESKQRLGSLESLTKQLQTNVQTLLREQTLVHDVVERIALLAEKTSVMSDRLQALQEHQTVSEKEIMGVKATMEKLVASMRAVDKSQLTVSNHMHALRFNVSDHDTLMKELLLTQTRDGRTLRKTMEELIAKNTAQTKAFEELKAQTSQTTGRFNALTASITKVSERNDKLSEQIQQLKQSSINSAMQFKGKDDLHSGDIEEMQSAQQVLMNQLHKLGNAEVVLASELKQFPNLVNQLTDDVRRTSAQEGQMDTEIDHLKSEMEALKMAISNLQVQQSVKPMVVAVNHPGRSANEPSMSDKLEAQLRLLNLPKSGNELYHHKVSREALNDDVIRNSEVTSHLRGLRKRATESMSPKTQKSDSQRQKLRSGNRRVPWNAQRRRQRSLSKRHRV